VSLIDLHTCGVVEADNNMRSCRAD